MTTTGEKEPGQGNGGDEALEALREAARAASDRIGLEAASAHEGWAYDKGKRYVSWAWLVPGEKGPQNCGFEFSRRGDREHLLAWGHGRTLHCEGPAGLASFPGLLDAALTLVTWHPAGRPQ